MKGIEIMTFAELLARLQRLDPSKALVFTTDDGEIGAGYHVTELRHSVSKGIDCGGNIETWEDAKLQLLDGQGSDHMTVGKFNNIVEKSLIALPELKDAPLLVEFGLNNERLMLMSLHGPEISGGKAVVSLGGSRAVCKPAIRHKLDAEDQGNCCGVPTDSPQESSCCGGATTNRGGTTCCA